MGIFQLLLALAVPAAATDKIITFASGVAPEQQGAGVPARLTGN